MEIYNSASEYAATKGIIIADTKFEFGLLNGEIIIIDEVLTPDSSRFWDKDAYEVGISLQVLINKSSEITLKPRIGIENQIYQIYLMILLIKQQLNTEKLLTY